MKKTFLASSIAAALAIGMMNSAAALDIDWNTFKTNHWPTATNADGFADAWRVVIRDQTIINGKAIALMDQPLFPVANGDIFGFYTAAKYDSSTCVVSYPTLNFQCTIDGSQAKLGGLPMEYDQATEVMWFSQFISALDAQLPTAGSVMFNDYVTALFNALTAANSDVTGSTGGKVLMGDGSYWRLSPTTGTISYTAAETDIVSASTGLMAGYQLIPGVNFTSSTGAAGLGAELVYTCSTKTLAYKEAGKTLGTAQAIGAGGTFTLVTGGGTGNFVVNVSSMNLMSTCGTDKMRVFMKQ